MTNWENAMFRLKNRGCIVAASLLVSCGVAEAATWHVAPCGNDAWAGTVPACGGPAGYKRTIQAAINAASNGDFVHVAPGVYTETIDLNGKAITLLGTGGAGVTIVNGNGNGPIVSLNSLEGPGTVIRGFWFQNGSTNGQGGAMLIALASPTIEECIFENNYAALNGGAIACVAASPTITDCLFMDNDAGEYPVAVSDGRGGAISISGGSPTITGCEFTQNAAFRAGGAVSIRDNASPTFEGCTFTSNLQLTSCFIDACDNFIGAAVMAQNSDTTFNDCVFDANVAAGTGAVGIDGGEATLQSCDFTSNDTFNAEGNLGGGALLGRDGAELTISGCTFDQNFIRSRGAALHLVQSSASVTLCTFSGNNTQDESGGAVHADHSTLAVTLSSFSNNDARTDGGAISADGGSLTVQSCVFLQNSTGTRFPLDGGGFDYHHGGAIYASGTAVMINGSTFTSNVSDLFGGAVTAFGPSLTVDGCTFNSNTGEYGGAVYSAAVSLVVQDSTFENNNAFMGGGVSLLSETDDGQVIDCQFISNTATWAGGLAGFGMSVVRSTFTDNTASESGGAVHTAGPNPTLRLISCVMHGNSAGDRGGAVHMGINAGIELANCLVYGNTAPGGGGAIAAGESTRPLKLVNCTVANNTGVGVAVFDAGTMLNIDNSIIWGNSGNEINAFGSEVRYSNVQGGYPGFANINSNPIFQGSLGGNYRLGPTSPCIDAGRNASLPLDVADLDADGNVIEFLPRDLAGNARVTNNQGVTDSGCGTGAIADMGAYETAGVGGVPPKPGDADGNGSVAFADITFILANWGPCATPCCPADVNGNGMVDFVDITTVLANFGL